MQRAALWVYAFCMKKKRSVAKLKKQCWEKKQIICINVDVFKVDVVIIVDGQEKDAIQWFKRVSDKDVKEFAEGIKGWDEDSKGMVEGRMFELMDGFVVFLKTYKSWIKLFGNLVHEMTHVTQYLLKHRRIPLSEDTDEVHAYLVEFLVKEAAKKLL